MRIEIIAETDEERKLNPEPWMQEGVSHVALVGRLGGAHVSYRSGNILELIGGLTLCIEDLRTVLNKQTVVAGFVEAHNMMMTAQAENAIAQEVLAGRNGGFPRIKRP